MTCFFLAVFSDLAYAYPHPASTTMLNHPMKMGFGALSRRESEEGGEGGMQGGGTVGGGRRGDGRVSGCVRACVQEVLGAGVGLCKTALR